MTNFIATVFFPDLDMTLLHETVFPGQVNKMVKERRRRVGMRLNETRNTSLSTEPLLRSALCMTVEGRTEKVRAGQ